jgi:glycosyltransferase involved in cell wall biosynthesis
MNANATPKVALAHDYITQRGGAERVVLSLVHTFPDAPVYTSLYDVKGTFPEFVDVDIRTLGLNAVRPFRRHHRWALPFLAPSFSRKRITPEADVVVCSSSGWAHAIHTDGYKIVYCHTPARWLYQGERYLGTIGPIARIGRALLRRRLERWDQKAARSADRYLANSTWIAQEIARIYGIEADVVHPPVTVGVDGPQQPVDSIEPGYVLCVSRLLPYKNVGAVIAAFARTRSEQLVVVGKGPEEAHLRKIAGENVHFTGSVGDAELRWLYQNASCLVAASYEDFGLTPVEAAAFGKPTAALRFGGFLDTVHEDDTGVLFDRPEPKEISAALGRLHAGKWSEARLREHAASFSEERFSNRMRRIVEESR